jgi:hypothetical protein
MSIEIRALVKAKNESLRRSRVLEAKRRKQCQSKETANSSEKNIPASQSMRPHAERLQESLISGSSPPSASSLQSIPSRLKNQDGQDHIPKLVSCEH